MAKVRIGFSTQFELENELVGIGTDNPTNTLQALGNIHATNTKAVGVSTFTTFDGFTDTKAAISGAGGSKSGSTSGEIIIEGTVNVSSGTTFTSGPENLTATDNFTLPGISDDKPSVGTMRFNENLASLEFYTGSQWTAVNSRVDMNGNTGRAIFAAGRTPGDTRNMEYFSLTSGGKGINFGDLNLGVNSQADSYKFGNSNEIRALFGGGYQSPSVPAINNIDYVTIASTGDGTDFGDLVTSSGIGVAVSSSTRGIQAGGWVSPSPAYDTNVIQYVEIMSNGNSIDFGDLLAKRRSQAGAQSPTRGLFAGGETEAGQGFETRIEQITIAAKGNSTTFGDMSFRKRFDTQNISNSVRGIFAGHGYGAQRKDIEYVTIASEGNGTYFGDLIEALGGCSGAASQTRGIVSGGFNPGSTTTTVETIIISTTGNATYFGDLNQSRAYHSGISDCHGGLGGF